MTRREFSRSSLTGLLGFLLFDSLTAADAFNNHIKSNTDHWVKLLNEYSGDLKKEAITLTEWQDLIEQLYARIPLEDILAFIDFEKLSKQIEFPSKGVGTKNVKFPKLKGLPENVVFTKKIFGMKKDRAIIPHGHSNMVSAHLVLKGEMHLRNYDRVELVKNEHMIIKPSLDKTVRPGDVSTMSEDHNNVHWFVADTPTAFTFDVIVLDLNQQQYDIHNLNMRSRTSLGNGTYRAPIIGMEDALMEYGALGIDN